MKLTFAKGAALADPAGLFNANLDGKVRRAIDIHEGDDIDGSGLQGADPRGRSAEQVLGQRFQALQRPSPDESSVGSALLFCSIYCYN